MHLFPKAGVLMALIVAIFGLSVVDTYLLRSGSLASVISATLVDLTNGDRGGNALGSLVINPVLTAAAQAKADDMAAGSYFAHTSPDGKNSWYWFKQAGYTFLYAGENLAVDFSDSIDVERAWMNSPTHRANILNGRFTEVGIATASGVYEGHQTTFVVQMFGTPVPERAVQQPIESETLPSEPSTPATAVAVSQPAATTSTTTVAVALTVPTEQVLGTEADSILAPTPAWWERLLASPKTVLEYAYLLIALIVLGILAYVTELEFHKRHMRHVATASFFFILMAGLFVIADVMLFSTPVLAAF